MPRLAWLALPARLPPFGSLLSQHPLQWCSSMCPLAPVGVWPFSGLCLPPPRGGRAEGNTFLIVSLPFMGCQGAEAAAPRPFPLCSLCLFSFPPRPPLRTPTPPAPLMLCRWEQGGHLGPSPFLPWVSCSPEPREGGVLRGELPPGAGTPFPLPHTHRVALGVTKAAFPEPRQARPESSPEEHRPEAAH